VYHHTEAGEPSQFQQPPRSSFYWNMKKWARCTRTCNDMGLSVVHKVALGQVFSEHFDLPCQFSFHWLLHTTPPPPHHHHHLSSRANTIGQIVANMPSGLSHPTPRKRKKKYRRSKDFEVPIWSSTQMCQLFQKEVWYPGHNVSPDRITMDPAKLTVV
jgi:hypothetical protein